MKGRITNVRKVPSCVLSPLSYPEGGFFPDRHEEHYSEYDAEYRRRRSPSMEAERSERKRYPDEGDLDHRSKRKRRSRSPHSDEKSYNRRPSPSSPRRRRETDGNEQPRESEIGQEVAPPPPVMRDNFYCDLCSISCTSEITFQQHLKVLF